jgi:hypothetical protein
MLLHSVDGSIEKVPRIVLEHVLEAVAHCRTTLSHSHEMIG